jgi:hypothetical protein
MESGTGWETVMRGAPKTQEHVCKMYKRGRKMEDSSTTTIVQNIMDDRLYVFALPARKAVVAAHEFFDRLNCQSNYHDPIKHPDLREHKRGFSCGDWVAFRPVDEDDVDELV